jgi:hypothetical protein
MPVSVVERPGRESNGEGREKEGDQQPREGRWRDMY